MELHSQYAAAKKLWIYLRLAFFMIRKSFISKRKKLIIDVGFMMKKGLKPLWKNLIITLNYSPRKSGHQLGEREYEFSCSNTPIPPCLRAFKHRRSFFSCIDAGCRPEAGDEPNDPAAAGVLEISNTVDDVSANYTYVQSSPLIILSPLPADLVDISDFSSAEDEDEEDHEQLRKEINDKAEEFIRKFYQQLRSQSHIASTYLNP